MYNNRSRGFTLIELLVVIAIIGVLSAVVLASLNTARTKGNDAAIKSNLESARVQAELFYSNGNTYASVCTTGSTSSGVSGLILAAAKVLSTSSVVGVTATAFSYDKTGVGAGSAVCHDSATAWAAIVSLQGPVTASSGWCVDSTGVAKEATALAASAVAC